MLFRRCLLVMAAFSSVGYAEDDIQAEMQRQFDQEQQDKARQIKPFDVGLGLGIGWYDSGFLLGWDAILGKRLINTERWGYGLQYHFLTGGMDAVYVTASPLLKPFQLKLGVASMHWNNTDELGLAIGAAALDRSWLNGKVEVHMLDLEEIFTANHNYTLISVSLRVFIDRVFK